MITTSFVLRTDAHILASSNTEAHTSIENNAMDDWSLGEPRGARGQRESISFRRRNGTFLGLIVTTTVSLLLVASNQRQWSISGGAYVTLNKYRSSVQIAVQVISAWFGFLQQNVVCQLFNYATRLRLRNIPPTLDAVYAWNCISATRTAWALRIKFLIPTLVFALAMLVPSALWAGAITPTLIVAQSPRPGSLHIPQFQNSSMIREWPSEIGSSGPLLRTAKGLFSFSPGVRMLGSLVASAASATTVDGGVRQHPKFDNTRYTYNGRSYGVGASAGLADSLITDDPLVLSYMFQENGLRADVECIYNSSTEFVITSEEDTYIYPAVGFLPDSGSSEEYSDYFGHGSDAIVAIGVTANNDSTERILGIAAGKSYDTLNATQCTITFVPRTFNVSVSLSDHFINVTDSSSGIDFAASKNLTHVLTRQFELIANDQTNLYVSLIGDSFNSSIANYNSSVSSNDSQSPSEASATLAGLTNSVTAMVDDLLVAYSSAQLMVMNDTNLVRATVKVHAFRYGSGVYIYLTLAINTVILLLVAEEALRTRGWKDLLYFDYMDPRSLIIGGSMGGSAIAHAAKDAWIDRKRPIYRYDSVDIGNVKVALHQNKSIILESSKSRQKELPRIQSRDIRHPES